MDFYKLFLLYVTILLSFYKEAGAGRRHTDSEGLLVDYARHIPHEHSEEIMRAINCTKTGTCENFGDAYRILAQARLPPGDDTELKDANDISKDLENKNSNPDTSTETAVRRNINTKSKKEAENDSKEVLDMYRSLRVDAVETQTEANIKKNEDVEEIMRIIENADEDALKQVVNDYTNKEKAAEAAQDFDVIGEIVHDVADEIVREIEDEIAHENNNKNDNANGNDLAALDDKTSLTTNNPTTEKTWIKKHKPKKMPLVSPDDAIRQQYHDLAQQLNNGTSVVRRRHGHGRINDVLVLDKPYDLRSVSQIKIVRKKPSKNLSILKMTSLEFDPVEGILEINIANEAKHYRIGIASSRGTTFEDFKSLGALSDVGRKNKKISDVSYLQVRFVKCLGALKTDYCTPKSLSKDLRSCCYRDATRYKEGWDTIIDPDELENMLGECIEKVVGKYVKMGERGKKIDTDCLNNALDYLPRLGEEDE